MATAIERARGRSAHPFAADGYERALAAGAVLLAGFVLAALARGQAEWRLVPGIVWLHLATILIALLLTPVMLLRPRGDALHRRLGMLWCAALAGTALVSFGIRTSPTGGFSVIHILSAWTLLQVPLIVLFARRHNVRRHRRSVRALVTGALLIAGLFTFPFGRLLGRWLFA